MFMVFFKIFVFLKSINFIYNGVNNNIRKIVKLISILIKLLIYEQ
jgi:hypothetical protein